MATKKDIIAKLGAAGIPHDPNASVASLTALLHPEDKEGLTDVKEAPVQKVNPELQARWDEFLATVEEQRKRDGTYEIFLAQKERGEFDNIPASFIQDHQVRVAPR